MRRVIITVIVVAVITTVAIAAWADFRRDFNYAVSRGQYKGAGDKETLDMIENVTRVLHEENLEILERLERIEELLVGK